MNNIPVLLPAPQNLKLAHGIYSLDDKHLILIDHSHPQSVLFSALQLQSALNLYFHQNFEIYASNAVQFEDVGITLRHNPQLVIKFQGYHLQITPNGIYIEAQDENGLFYGCRTLIQLIQYYFFVQDKNHDMSIGCLPCLEITDWPDFPNRGVMLDISRDKVPTMETLYNLVDLLASWKINQIQLYTEHTFSYHQHPEVWSEASPITGEQILILDGYCRERFIELVPNQNSFGHLDAWLKLPKYKYLAEAPDGFDFPWGHHDGPFSLCPTDPASLNLIKSMYDELLPYFSSRQINVGCDETFDLGQGRSKAECERLGTGRVYLDFLLKIHQEVTNRGFHMQFWGDMIMTHPELIKELPKDIIALEWGYEANHPFEENGEKFAQSGHPFYVCPGTSSWNSIAGRTNNCLMNLANAAKNGFKYGADGYLITDWGDNGHWQSLLVSYLGFAAGAAYAWSYQTNHDLNIREVLNRYAFLDPTGNMGDLAFDLGNVYHQVGIEHENASALFLILQNPIHSWKRYLEPESAIQTFHHTLRWIDQVSEKKSNNDSYRSDMELIKREFQLTVDLLRHACIRGLYGFDSSEYSQNFLINDMERITAEYQLIWLSRNRPGGLKDSLSYFEIAQKEYQGQLES